MNNPQSTRPSSPNSESALLLRIIKSVASLIVRVPFLSRNFKRVLFEQEILDSVLEDERLARMVEFRTIWHRLKDKLDFDMQFVASRYESGMNDLKLGKKSVKDTVLDLICEGQDMLLAQGKIRFSDRESLWILLYELLINEEYYFESTTEKPTILDCGCHFGLATIYFKKLFPQARVIAFEPIPHIRKLAQLNFSNSGLSDVQVLPYALTDQEGKSTFYVPEQRPMASSLINRLEGRGEEIVEHEVECRKLSDYLKEPVNFLKLDIEGTEYKVIREIQGHLENVQYLFCECHKVDEHSDRDMNELLSILSNAGFDYRCTNSWATQMRTARRPMNFVGEPLSNIVFAKNRNWKN